MKLWKPKYGWFYLACRAAWITAAVMSGLDLLLGHDAWSVAWVGVGLGAAAHSRLELIERRAATKEESSP